MTTLFVSFGAKNSSGEGKFVQVAWVMLPA
jgi:hypothetical protein